MPRIYTQLLYHIVFSTARRKPQIDATLSADLHAYLGGIVANLRGRAIRVGGMPDHVHILCALPADVAVADAVRTIKANSSRWVHEAKARPDFAWQEGYAAFSVSRSLADKVADYIARQEEHHRVRPFKEEYLEFLRRHGVEFDTRWVVDED